MTLSQIRTRLTHLKRKYALPLAILRLRIQAEKLALEWNIAQANRRPLPPPNALVTQIARASRLPRPDRTALLHHFERLQQEKTTPSPLDIVHILLPQAANPALSALLKYDLPPHLSPAAAI